MVVFAWVDQDRQYFIAKTEYLEEGEADSRDRWIHVAVYFNAYSQMVDLDIPQPVSEYMYYYTCNAVD